MNSEGIRRLTIVSCLVALFMLRPADGVLPTTPDSPTPGSGLHVLIVEDRMNRRSLPPAQFDAMMSAKVDDLIRQHKGYKYLYDKNQDVSTKDDPWVRDAMKLPRKSLPWLVIDNNGKGVSRPFPNTPGQEIKQFEELVEQYTK